MVLMKVKKISCASLIIFDHLKLFCPHWLTTTVETVVKALVNLLWKTWQPFYKERWTMLVVTMWKQDFSRRVQICWNIVSFSIKTWKPLIESSECWSFHRHLQTIKRNMITLKFCIIKLKLRKFSELNWMSLFMLCKVLQHYQLRKVIYILLWHQSSILQFIIYGKVSRSMFKSSCTFVKRRKWIQILDKKILHILTSSQQFIMMS